MKSFSGDGFDTEVVDGLQHIFIRLLRIDRLLRSTASSLAAWDRNRDLNKATTGQPLSVTMAVMFLRTGHPQHMRTRGNKSTNIHMTSNISNA